MTRKELSEACRSIERSAWKAALGQAASDPNLVDFHMCDVATKLDNLEKKVVGALKDSLHD